MLREKGWWDTRKGSKHEKWTNGKHTVAVPRHRELPKGTVDAILKQLSAYENEEVDDHDI